MPKAASAGVRAVRRAPRAPAGVPRRTPQGRAVGAALRTLRSGEVMLLSPASLGAALFQCPPPDPRIR